MGKYVCERDGGGGGEFETGRGTERVGGERKREMETDRQTDRDR